MNVNAAPRMSATRWITVVLSILLAALAIAVFARSAQIALSNAPSFDGAMNLQVARSIADGKGYRRNYSEQEAFPQEIQTGPPYVLPAAAVFKLAGVGIAQAEIVNVIYLGLFALVAVWLVARPGGLLLGLLAACTLLLIPGLHEYGFYGYGEVPALAWALAAIAIYFGHEHAVWRGIAAGLMLGLAVYTKTVMLIGAGALGLSALIELAANWRNGSSRVWIRFAMLIAGGIAVIVAMEIWRAFALGGFYQWKTWWHTSVGEIFTQAGVDSGLAGKSHSMIAKAAAHFGLLAGDYRLSALFTGLVLLALAIGFLVTIVWAARRRQGSWPLLAVFLIVFVYFIWWLFITPTAVAWHRRILDGMLAGDLGLVMAVGLGVGAKHKLPAWGVRGIAGVLCAGLALAFPCFWLVRGVHTLWFAPASARVCEHGMATQAECSRYVPGADVAALQRVSRAVRRLPKEAYVFAFGWYSAPQLGLFSGRRILDFHNVPINTLDRSRPVYFVQGAQTPASSLQRIHELYGISTAPIGTFAVFRAERLTPLSIVAGSARVERYIKAGDHYPYLRGFNSAEGPAVRWLTSDNLALLAPRQGDQFKIVAYVLPADKYESHQAPDVTVSFNGCLAVTQRTQPGKVNVLYFPIPARCNIHSGQPVNVRIEVGDIVRSSIMHDPRELQYSRDPSVLRERLPRECDDRTVTRCLHKGEVAESGSDYRNAVGGVPLRDLVVPFDL